MNIFPWQRHFPDEIQLNDNNFVFSNYVLSISERKKNDFGLYLPKSSEPELDKPTDNYMLKFMLMSLSGLDLNIDAINIDEDSRKILSDAIKKAWKDSVNKGIDSLFYDPVKLLSLVTIKSDSSRNRKTNEANAYLGQHPVSFNGSHRFPIRSVN